MKRRPEAKGENFPLCSILSLGRPVHVRGDRRDDGNEIIRVNQNVSRLVNLSDYGPALLVTARCGPACRVVWELRLEAHEIQQPEMAVLVKPSQQPGTESCVVSGNGHCEA